MGQVPRPGPEQAAAGARAATRGAGLPGGRVAAVRAHLRAAPPRGHVQDGVGDGGDGHQQHGGGDEVHPEVEAGKGWTQLKIQ